MSSNPDTGKNNNSTLKLYDEILGLVEEEIFQRKNGQSYRDSRSTREQVGGYHGNFQTGGAVPGKFDAIRHSLDIPLNVAIRGTVSRQQLFAQECGM